MYACASAARTERICVIFHIGDFYEDLSSKSKFDYNRTKISGTLHEDLSTLIVTGDKTAIKSLLTAKLLFFISESRNLFTANYKTYQPSIKKLSLTHSLFSCSFKNNVDVICVQYVHTRHERMFEEVLRRRA